MHLYSTSLMADTATRAVCDVDKMGPRFAAHNCAGIQMNVPNEKQQHHQGSGPDYDVSFQSLIIIWHSARARLTLSERSDATPLIGYLLAQLDSADSCKPADAWCATPWLSCAQSPLERRTSCASSKNGA